jgi:hypothetical protein
MKTMSGVAAMLAHMAIVAPAEAAETRATIVMTRENYCSGSSCSVAFPKTLAGKRLEIENVSCSVSVTAGAIVTNPFIAVQKTPGEEAFRFHFPPLGKHGEEYGQGLFSANYTGLVPVAAGRAAQVHMFVKDTTFVRMNCTISGHLYGQAG